MLEISPYINYQHKNSADAIYTSLKENGFFVLNNHGLSVDKLPNVYRAWKRFFASDKKKQYTRSDILDEGYVGIHNELHKNASKADQKEFYQGHFPSRFPDFIDLSSTKLLLNEFFTLGEDIIHIIDERLPQKVKDSMATPFSTMMEGANKHCFRVIHYPKPSQNTPTPNSNPHTDICLLTLLPCPTSEGMAIKIPNNTWLEPTIHPDSIIIFNSDMLELCTHGYLHSVSHRVLLPEDHDIQARYSFPIFIHPRREAQLTKDINAYEAVKKRLTEIGFKGDLFEG